MTDDEYDALDALHRLEAQIQDTRWTIDERTFMADDDGQAATLELEYVQQTPVDARDEVDLKAIIGDLESEYGKGAPISKIVARATDALDIDGKEARDAIERLRKRGDVYEPTTDHLRVV